MEINDIKTCHLKSGCAYTYFPCFFIIIGCSILCVLLCIYR